jgi:RNA polymerase sigma-70 factor (ECF subfamily)
VLCRLRAGDEVALDELIDRKSKALLNLAYRVVGDREEARDVVQMAFVRIWDHRDRFDERWSPNTWIYRITTNLAIDHLRARQSKDRQREPLQFHLQRNEQGSARRLLGDLREKEVQEIFTRLARCLTEKQRAIFVLREMEGMSSVEIAEMLGCKESTIRNHLFNARKVLQRALLERFPEYAPAGRREQPEVGS